MKRKLSFALLFILFCSLNALSQNNQDTVFETVFNACVSMRDAAATHDTAALRQAAGMLRKCNVAKLQLRPLQEYDGTLDGHLLFDEDFADSLIADTTFMSRSESFVKSIEQDRSQRGGSSAKAVTCFAKAEKTYKYSFRASGPQKIAVVAESGGLVTLKVHVTNRDGLDERYDDQDDVWKGRPYRRVSFNLPNKANTIELEIINCSKKDISFHIISN
ncbi:MAG: hypothetical protein J6X58_08095 [Bacteroidales bacterium]|nr:hypothetical protein [Bacteroidales bacterium]